MWENPETCLITFGQPRYGDKRFALKHDELIHTYRKLRFVNGIDDIPHINPWFIHHSRYVYCNLTLFNIISGIPFIISGIPFITLGILNVNILYILKITEVHYHRHHMTLENNAFQSQL